jgi:hypothetical protein
MTRTKKIGVAAAALLVVISLAACEKSDSNAQTRGQDQTEQAFNQQETAVPYPVDQLKDSLERRNLKEHLLRYNNPSKISYIYLLADTGGIYTFFTIKGKVSSNQSQMTTENLIVRRCWSGNCESAVVNAPGDDGSYGPNEDGIFFFTTDGVLITWNGKYLLSDAPLKVNAANMVLTYTDGSKPTK